MSLFTTLLMKALEKSLADKRIGTYRAPELMLPEYGAAHRTYGSRVYDIYALKHALDWTRFPDGLSAYVDSQSWTKQERAAHLQSIVGKHRRRVR